MNKGQIIRYNISVRERSACGFSPPLYVKVEEKELKRGPLWGSLERDEFDVKSERTEKVRF